MKMLKRIGIILLCVVVVAGIVYAMYWESAKRWGPRTDESSAFVVKRQIYALLEGDVDYALTDFPPDARTEELRERLESYAQLLEGGEMRSLVYDFHDRTDYENGDYAERLGSTLTLTDGRVFYFINETLTSEDTYAWRMTFFELYTDCPW